MNTNSFAPTLPPAPDALPAEPTFAAPRVDATPCVEAPQPARPLRLAPYIAFFIAVFASMAAAAAAVASNDMPVMVVGLL